MTSAGWWQKSVDPGRVRRLYLAAAALLGLVLAVRHLYFSEVRWQLSIQGVVRVEPGQPPPELSVYLHFPRERRRYGTDRKSVALVNASGGRRFPMEFDFKAQRDTDPPPEATLLESNCRVRWQRDGEFVLDITVPARRAPVGAQLVIAQSGTVRLVSDGFALERSDPFGGPALSGLAPQFRLPNLPPGPTALNVPLRVGVASHSLPRRLGRRQFARVLEELTDEALPEVEHAASSSLAAGPWVQRCEKDQIYVGVGGEENLTYIAVLQPRFAFILTGDRKALLRQLLHKALIEQAATPHEYLRLLFCREIGAGAIGPAAWLK